MSHQFTVLVDEKPVWFDDKQDATDFYYHNGYLVKAGYKLELCRVECLLPGKKPTLRGKTMLELLLKCKQVVALYKVGDYLGAGALAAEIIAEVLKTFKPSPVPVSALPPADLEAAIEELEVLTADVGKPGYVAGPIAPILLPILLTVLQEVLKRLLNK